MGFFTPQTSVVDLGDGNKVTIRKMTYGQNSEIGSKCFKNGIFDVFQHGVERMVLSVASWEGPGFEGQPVSPENVKALPPDVAKQLNDAIATLNKDVGEDEGNASGAATN